MEVSKKLNYIRFDSLPTSLIKLNWNTLGLATLFFSHSGQCIPKGVCSYLLITQWLRDGSHLVTEGAILVKYSMMDVAPF